MKYRLPTGYFIYLGVQTKKEFEILDSFIFPFFSDPSPHKSK